MVDKQPAPHPEVVNGQPKVLIVGYGHVGQQMESESCLYRLVCQSAIFNARMVQGLHLIEQLIPIGDHFARKPEPTGLLASGQGENQVSLGLLDPQIGVDLLNDRDGLPVKNFPDSPSVTGSLGLTVIQSARAKELHQQFQDGLVRTPNVKPLDEDGAYSTAFDLISLDAQVPLAIDQSSEVGQHFSSFHRTLQSTSIASVHRSNETCN